MRKTEDGDMKGAFHYYLTGYGIRSGQSFGRREKKVNQRENPVMDDRAVIKRYYDIIKG